MTTTPRGQIKREGRVSFGDASVDVWEDGISEARDVGGYDGQRRWERDFKRQVFARIVQALRRRGWTCTMPPIDPHSVKHYGGNVARWSAERKRFCTKGDLKADLSVSGRHIEFNMFQSVNCPTRADHEGRYEHNKEDCMPYVLRLEMERTRRKIRDYLCNVFSGYEFDPINRSNEYKPLRITAIDRITRKCSRNKGPREPGEYDSKSADGQRLKNGMRVFFFDNKGRIATGTAFCDGSMWDIVTGRWDWARRCNHELHVAIPENLRVKRNERQRRKRLEAELAKAIKTMDFKRAEVLKHIIWPQTEPLFHIVKNGAYFRPDYSGYTNDIIVAGKYSAAELKPYASDIKHGSLKAIPVAQLA